MQSVWYLSPFNQNYNVSINFSTTFDIQSGENPEHESSASYIRTDRQTERANIVGVFRFALNASGKEIEKEKNGDSEERSKEVCSWHIVLW
jgi:hypothetical protein